MLSLVARRAITPRSKITLLSRPSTAIRFFSSGEGVQNISSEKPQQITREEAKGRAQQILAYFPGETNFKKATYATITGGLTAFFVSSGLYIPNDETLVVVAFAITTRFLYVKLATPVANLIDAGIKEIRDKMMKGRLSQMSSIESEISEISELRDFADVTSEIFQTKGETMLLESQLHELQERNKFLSDIKSKLDDAVRKETERLGLERRALIDKIMAGVMEKLKEPKLQDSILKKCLLDLERMPPTANASKTI